jgi:hypothetical protein
MGAPIGNQNAKKAKIWADAVRKAIDKFGGVDLLAEELVKAGLSGERWALQEIGDRLDGKPPQAIIGDEDSPPVMIREIIIRPVDASRSSEEGG